MQNWVKMFRVILRLAMPYYEIRYNFATWAVEMSCKPQNTYFFNLLLPSNRRNLLEPRKCLTGKKLIRDMEMYSLNNLNEAIMGPFFT